MYCMYIDDTIDTIKLPSDVDVEYIYIISVLPNLGVNPPQS